MLANSVCLNRIPGVFLAICALSVCLTIFGCGSSGGSGGGTGPANSAPTVTTNPVNQTVAAGSSVSFTAAASGTPTPTVQWQVSTNGGAAFSNVSGATSATYTFTAAAGQNGNEFRAVFTNSVGTATTTAAKLTVNVAPVITTNPSSQAVSAGSTASFTAAASGTPAPTVQWQVSTNGGTTFSNVSGATSATYNFTAGAQDGNQFRAVFTNSVGTATTSAATLTVSPAFVSTGSLNTERADHTATLLNNGMVLIAGGYDSASGNELASAELYNPTTGTFTLTGSLNTARRYHTATLLPNGMVLIAGGFSSTGNNVFASAELYNPATGTFTPAGSLNMARYWHTATLLNDSMVLFAGGYGASGATLSSAELYDPATGTFTPTGSLNTARDYHTGTLLNNGMVLIAGGYGASGATLTSAELYDPATQSFTPTGSLNTSRFVQTATLLNDGTVLIAGGYFSNGSSIAVLNSAEVYDPTTGTFTVTSNLNTARVFHTASLLSNGMVLIAGGWGINSSGSGFAVLTSAELYDPANGTSTPTVSLNTARDEHTATLLNDGMVLMTGGSGSSNTLANAELYEPATLTPPNLVSIAVTPAASTLSPGTTQQFIATGTFSDTSTQQLGSVTWSSSNSAVAQITNDATNHGVGMAIAAGTVTITATDGNVNGTATLTVRATGFVATGSLNSARRNHTATLLNNGLVLVAGGVDNSLTALTSAELYDPATGTFTPTGSLHTARWYHTSTLLNNGMVLIVGGTNTSGTSLTSVELYNPATGTFTTTGSLNTARGAHTATLLNDGTVLIAGGAGSSGLL